jgi:hypothetical protein
MAPPSELCVKAIVGRGHAEVLTTFPETTPMKIDLESAFADG